LIADIQEIFGAHYELPELGPIGSNGLALPKDFEIPVASFDIDSSDWEGKAVLKAHLFHSRLTFLTVVVLKLAGELYHYSQNHTPFDVVGWHGKYVKARLLMHKH